MTQGSGFMNCRVELQEYKIEKANVWFIRMALDLHCTVMACGNTLGQVFLWDMHSLTDKPVVVLSRDSAPKAQGKSAPNITVCMPRIALASDFPGSCLQSSASYVVFDASCRCDRQLYRMMHQLFWLAVKMAQSGAGMH